MSFPTPSVLSAPRSVRPAGALFLLLPSLHKPRCGGCGEEGRTEARGCRGAVKCEPLGRWMARLQGDWSPRHVELLEASGPSLPAGAPSPTPRPGKGTAGEQRDCLSLYPNCSAKVSKWETEWGSGRQEVEREGCARESERESEAERRAGEGRAKGEPERRAWPPPAWVSTGWGAPLRGGARGGGGCLADV